MSQGCWHGGLEAFGIVFLSGSTGERIDSREALSEIRRDLVLGGISTTEGSHRARTILQGMWLSDVVMKDMDVLLKLISTARGEYDDALGKLTTFKTSDDVMRSEQAPDIGRLTLSNMLDTLDAHELRVCDAIARYQRLLASLRLRLQLVAKIQPDAETDSRRLIAEVQAAQAPVDRLQGRFVTEYMELQRVWNLRFPNEPRNHEPFAQLRKRLAVKREIRWR